MFPADELYGSDTSYVFGLYALSDNLQLDFKSFLLSNGYADTQSRANTIWTQAREYYYEDTGTVTRRPHRDAVNNFTASRFQGAGRVPFFTSVPVILDWNESYPDTEFTPRYNSGNSDINQVYAYAEDGGLVGISAIVSEGGFAYLWVMKNSQ